MADFDKSSLGKFRIGYDKNGNLVALPPVYDSNPDPSSSIYNKEFIDTLHPDTISGSQGASSSMSGAQMALAGASIFSSVASMFTAWSNSKTEKKLYAIQAKMQALQARAAQNQAEDILRAGNQKVAAITYQAGQAKASSKVSMAAAGVRVGTGSSAEVLASHDIVKEMQVNQTVANAIAQSYGAKRQALNTSNKAIAIEAQAQGISPWGAALKNGIASLYDSKEKGFLPDVNAFSGSNPLNIFGEDSGLKG